MNYLQMKKKAMLNYVSGGGLPSAYQQVEYIESDGQAYIDTEYYPSSLTNISSEYYRRGQVQKGFMGVRDSSQLQYRLRFHADRVRYYFGTEYFDPQYTYYSQTLLRTIQIQDKSLIGNGVTRATATSDFSTLDKTIYLFAWNNNGTVNEIQSGLKIVSFTITENGTTQRDFIPCYRKSDTEIGLYDLIGRQFYTNSGSGTFTKGQDV